MEQEVKRKIRPVSVMWKKSKLGMRGILVLVAFCALTGVLALSLNGMSARTAAETAAAPTVAQPASGPFTVVDLAERSLDGLPALALTFSEPLDPTHSYDHSIQVLRLDGDAASEKQGERENEQEADSEEDSVDGSDTGKTGAAEQKAANDSLDGGTPVKGAWVLGDNPRLLYFPHISPQSRYAVLVTESVQDRQGRNLVEGKNYRISTAAVAPAYYFASRGMVLPARQNGGLPVVTVNVPEVDVQFLKVREDKLPAFLDRVISSPPGKVVSDIREDDGEGNNDRTDLRGAVDYWTLDRIHKLTKSVYSGRFVTEQKANRRSVTFLPVEEIKELAEPGVYVAVMSQPNRFLYEYQVSYFYVSDLGLHTRLFAKTADVYLSSLIDGKAVPQVEVRWLDAAGKQLARALSDKEGRAHFEPRPQGAKVIQAQLGNQVSMIALKEPALDLSEFSISGEPGKPVRLFAWSGRDLYRPGERFDISVLARDADGRSLGPLPVQAILKRPDGKKQFTSSWQSGKMAGYYQETIELPLDAPTGFWSLELRADPADRVPATVYRFGVEEFLPERMKLDISAPEQGLNPEKALAIEASGTYLYGAPAADNRLLGVAQFKRSSNPLEAVLPGFVFGDANEESLNVRQELPELQLDVHGKGVLQVDLSPARKRQSPISVRATISLLESGGRPVVRSLERVLWPAPSLVGVRPLFVGDYARENAPVQFEVVRAGQDGQLLAASALPVRLFRENRNYYWRFDDERGWNSGFTETDELVATSELSIAAGQRGGLTLPVQYGRYRLEINDPDSGQTMKYRFYAGWSAKSDESQGIRPDRVALKLDKPAYQEGRDTVLLTITPPHGGQALITVEGDGTLWTKRMLMPAEGTTVSIPVAASWQRHDLYVSALVLRPGSEGDRITPARALGIAPLPLERASRKLEVTLEAPEKMRPEQDMQVKVRVPGASGKEALITLSAVDAGILNITSFATPDPFAFFFGQLRYGADLHDIYGRLIEKMAGKKGKLRFGGDAAPKNTKGLPKKVRLVDLFSGPVLLDANGEATVTLPVPDFNGTLRLMAVAATQDSYGSGEKEVVVAAPLVAELSTPRFLSVGDEATVALDLHNLSGGRATLTVHLPATPGLTVHSPMRRLVLADQKKAILRFPVTADQEFLGLADLRVQVQGSTGAGPLKLERSFALEVKPLTPEQQQRRFFEVQPGATAAIREADLAGFMPASVLAHLNLSDTPPLDVRSAVQGLLSYPYGCVEQTTSTAYPHLYIDEDKARSLGLRPYTLAQRSAMLAKAISRLSAAQGANGGFSLWGGADNREYWLSAYVGNFLQDARERGFEVPAEMHRKTMDFLLKHLQEGISGVSGKPVRIDPEDYWIDSLYAGAGRFNVLAYGGYVLARETKAPLSTLRQLYDLRASAASGLSLVQLGLALQLMGDVDKGAAAIREGLQTARLQSYWLGDYGSDLRDMALAYALLKRHNVDLPGVDSLLPLIAAQLKDSSWLSTQEKMAVFLAGGNVLADPTQAGTHAPWQATLHNAAGEQQLTAKDSMLLPLSVQDLATGLQLRNTAKRPIYAELSFSGRPLTMPAALNNTITLSRQLYTPDGKAYSGDHLQSGSSLIVQVKVESPTPIANTLVVDHIPAGLEIENLNIVKGEGMGQLMIGDLNVAEIMADDRILHQEFREDRYVAALNLRKSQDLFYRVRVVTPGRYTWPTLYAEDMYRPAINGLFTGGGSITVVEGAMR